MDSSTTYYPPPAFYFKLSFDGISGNTDVGFQEASGLNAELEVEEVICGGENRFRYHLPKQAKYGNLVLKRGMVTANSQLAKWCQDTLYSGLVSAVQTKNITLFLLGADGKPLMTWSFVNAYPVKWNASDFKSQDNSYVIESLEFAYNYFTKV